MKLVLLALLYLWTIPLAALADTVPSKYSVRHYTSENGLPQNSVVGIARDRDGFIWLATYDGLVRFDGQSLVTPSKTELGLQRNIFLGFLQDADRLYALTEDYDYIRLRTGRAVKDENPPVTRLRKMFQAREGSFGLTYSIGFPDRFHENWLPYRRSGQAGENWLPSHYVFFIPDSNGDFFIWQKDGSVSYYTNWKKHKSYATQIRLPHDIFRIGRSLYNDDRAGNIELLATGSGTVAVPRKVKITPTRARDAKPDLTKPYVIYSQDLSGDVFVYQDQRLFMLSQLNGGDLRTQVLLEGFDFQRNNVASVLFDDKNKRLYLGTLNNGLFIVDFKVFETLTIDSSEPEANVYYAQTAFSDSTVITPSFKVLGKSSTGQTIAYELPLPVKNLTMNRYSIFKSRSGDLWCKRDSLLYRFDGTGRRLKGQWSAGGEISHLYEDAAGRIWLGTRFAGLRYIDPTESGTPVHIFTHKITKITYMLSEGSDILWVAADPGLYKVNLSRKTFSLIPETDKYYIKSLFIPRPGELWFTTFGHGFFLLQNDKLTRLPLDKNHYLGNAHCVVGDRNGFFWMPTNRGLFRIHRKDLLDFTVHRDSTRLYYHHYNKQSGFRTDEFNGGCQPCAVRLRNGYVSLPSIDGLVFFKPEEMPFDVPLSEIFIDRIETNSRNLPFSGSRITLSGSVTDLKVFISSPYPGNQENQQLYYTVSSENRDETGQVWFPIENERQFIHLNNLESGTFVLKVRSNGGFGLGSERLTVLTIIIPYKWYETWPFRILVVILFITALVFYFRNRLKKVSRQNKVLELRVSERTKSLQDTLSALEISEQELIKQTRLQMHLIASISHDIRSPLRFIEFASSKLPALIQKGDPLAENVGLSVSESSRKILQMVENMLSYAKSQALGGAVSFEMTPARKLADEVAGIFAAAMQGRQNTFQNQLPETLELHTNQQLLKVILHNLIDNANKFTLEGSIRIGARQDGGVTTLFVADTGRGIPDPILKWFNEGEAAYMESAENESGTGGIGLVIVRELAELLKLKIRALSVSGTTFSITFEG